MKKILLILFLITLFQGNSQNTELKTVKLSFYPSFHLESELILSNNKSKGIFELKEVSIVKGNSIKRVSIKHKFRTDKDEISYVYKQIDLLYKDSIEKKEINEEGIEEIWEDGMMILIELKFKNDGNINFTIGNNFNKFQKNLLVEIIEYLKRKIPKESEYFNELIEYL